MSDLGYYKMHALVVDDFENFRSSLHKMLSNMGIGNVDSAQSGEEALRHTKARAYDLILCDLNLGKGKSGQQVLEELRMVDNPCADSLFVLVSAETSKGIIMAAYDYEPDAYLTKPITPKSLDQRLSRLMEQRHELRPIITAQRQGNLDEAIVLSKKLIASGSRYINSCQKMLGQMYLKEKKFADAEALYRSVLDNRELEWAQLGMAHTKAGEGDLIGAQQWLEAVLQNNPLCMKAYDLQADIYQLQGALQPMQEVLKRATEISPLSILRQQALGDVAQQNNDLVTAANALRSAVKLGNNSTFDKPEVHTRFVQATIDLSLVDADLAKPLMRDAVKCVSETEEKFGKSPDRKARSLFLDAQLQFCAGDSRKAMASLTAAQEVVDEMNGGSDIDVKIEMVRALRLLGRSADAAQQLSVLLHQYCDDEEQLQKLDVLLEEPRSEKNKLMVAEINKKGIALYNAKDYTAAAESFNIALQKLPNHLGLRLNLVQALVDNLKNNADMVLMERVQQAFTYMGKTITQQHAQYRRYRQLLEAFNDLKESKNLRGAS